MISKIGRSGVVRGMVWGVEIFCGSAGEVVLSFTEFNVLEVLGFGSFGG